LKGQSDLEVVAEAQNASELLQKIPNYDCDILLLDLDIPGKSESELINEVKMVNPKIPILAMSIHSEDRHTLKILKAGASGYICKDSAFEDLVTAIWKVITHGRYLSEKLTDLLALEFLGVKQPKPHDQLSNRELETMYMLVSGKRVKEIAEKLSLSESTIFTYRERIFDKLEIKTNVQLMRYPINNDLIEINNNVDV